ncbi:hypothetical protein GCM10010174_64640 [Kutzneria viridogrisea]|uniref:DNA-binding protein YbaB n=1 Tax=Kutzneria viridogrisea TaxID=47990 RepID=A0ABR6BG49_9PSEU|nr:DNA-binding protein YbaB [Kutzneria viridogrisea]
MSDDRRWGFEDAEDWEYDSGRAAEPSAEQPLTGADPAGVVTVTVSPTAEVRSVRLTPGWRGTVDPRSLHSAVLAAANTASIRALAAQAEQEPPPPQHTPAPPPPLTSPEDLARLIDAAAADLDGFTRQLSAVVDHPVPAHSGGGHVRGSAQRGRVLSLELDADWAAVARDSEIESELVEVLRLLRGLSVPGESAQTPTSPAITELTALVSDPQRLLRGLGLVP